MSGNIVSTPPKDLLQVFSQLTWPQYEDDTRREVSRRRRRSFNLGHLESRTFCWLVEEEEKEDK